jgi:hypothetical protein
LYDKNEANYFSRDVWFISESNDIDSIHKLYSELLGTRQYFRILDFAAIMLIIFGHDRCCCGYQNHHLKYYPNYHWMIPHPRRYCHYHHQAFAICPFV